MRYLLVILLCCVALPASAAQTTASFKRIAAGYYQVMRCNDGVTPENATNGEECATGDHSPPIAARDASVINLQMRTTVTTAKLTLWDCHLNHDGTYDAATKPSGTSASAVGKQFCTELSVGTTDSGADVSDSITGLPTTPNINSLMITAPRPGLWEFLVIEVKECTTCDFEAFLSVR